MEKKLKISVFILLGIIGVFCILIIFLGIELTQNTGKENYEYIISDEMKKETKSPEMIHVILSLYKGEVNPKFIAKSNYYFIDSVIPRYQKECKNLDKAQKYFSDNKEDIYYDTGIEEEQEFLDLIENINKLNKSKIESSRFDKKDVIVSDKCLETKLYVKSKKDTEIKFKVTIDNKMNPNTPFIKYSAN